MRALSQGDMPEEVDAFNIIFLIMLWSLKHDMSGTTCSIGHTVLSATRSEGYLVRFN